MNSNGLCVKSGPKSKSENNNNVFFSRNLPDLCLSIDAESIGVSFGLGFVARYFGAGRSPFVPQTGTDNFWPAGFSGWRSPDFRPCFPGPSLRFVRAGIVGRDRELEIGARL